MNNVLKGQVEMVGREWRNVTQAAKDLVLRMLTFDPEKRPTADECLNHPFIADKIKHSFSNSFFSV